MGRLEYTTMLRPSLRPANLSPSPSLRSLAATGRLRRGLNYKWPAKSMIVAATARPRQAEQGAARGARTGAVNAGAAQKLTERSGSTASRPAPTRSARFSRAKHPRNRQPRRRGRGNPHAKWDDAQELKKKYGEITMLDFPQWTKDTSPASRTWTSSRGSSATSPTIHVCRPGTFDPSTPSGRKWLERLAANTATGVKVHHISNNAPTNLSSATRRCARRGSRSERSGSTAPSSA